MRSLSARLLLAVSVLLLLFFGFAIVALEAAFRDSAEQAIRDRLNVQMLMLIAATDSADDGTLTLPEQLPEARFMSPGSGLIGQVIGREDELIWRSLSAVGVFLPVAPLSNSEFSRFERATTSYGEDMFSYSFAVDWEFSNGETRTYTFSVAESIEPYLAQVGRFRKSLITLFGVVMAMLLASQAVVLRWVLKPLRQVEAEIEAIETGDRADLSAEYPTELHGLTRNTNRLLDAERKRLSRYRNTLGNLAHSLKTPLAIIRNMLEKEKISTSASSQIQDQVDRMSDIVGYQLQRAAASGGTTLGVAKENLTEVIRVIVDSLQKVYADKGIDCQIKSDPQVEYRAERGDLMEIFGNLLDNAFKWSQHEVRVNVRSIVQEGCREPGLQITVDDDGPGISIEDAQRVLKRGQRADESVGGHGIGLSVVRELVELMEGQIEIERNANGGASITVALPAR